MGIIIRQSIKSSIITYFGVVIGAVNVLFLFTKYLSADEIGIYRLLIANALLISAVIQFGGNNIIDKFFPVFKTEDKRHHGFLALMVTYPLLSFGLFVVVYLVFKEDFLALYQAKSPKYNSYYLLLIPLVLFYIYNSILEAYCRAHLRIVVPVFIREVLLKIYITLIVFLYGYQYISFSEFILYFTLFYGVMSLLLLGYIAYLDALYFKFDVAFISKSLLKKMAHFGFYIVLGGLGTVLINQVDMVMLGNIIGERSVGIYSIPFFIGTIVEVPRKSLSQIATPIISRAWNENNLSEIKNIYQKSSINQTLIGGLLLCVIWVNVDAIFVLIPNGDVYVEGKWIILYIGLTRFIQMLAGVSTEIILQSKYYKFNLLLTLGLALLIVATNSIFIPIYGINGAAFATLFSVILHSLIKYVFIWKKFDIQPFKIKTLLALLVLILAYGIGYYLPDFSNLWLTIFFKSSTVIIIVVVLTFVLQLSDDALSLVYYFLNRIRRL